MLDGLNILCCKDTLLFPAFLYASIKEIIPNTENQEPVSKIILTACRLVLTLSLCIPLACFIIMMSFYFEIVRTFAKVKFDKNYVGYCTGKDAHFSYDKDGGTVVHMMLIVEDSGLDTPAKLLEMFRKHTTKKVLPLHPRLSCTKESFMGYLFYVRKQNLDIQSIINYMEDYHNYAEYKEVICKIISSPLPYENKFMWEIRVGKQLVETGTGELGYPVAIRMHHTSMDAITAMAFATGLYGKEGVNFLPKLPESVPKKNNFLNRIKEGIKMLWNTEIYLHHKGLTHIEPISPLHVEHPSGNDKLIGISIEPKKGETFKMIKLIRSKLNVRFSDVINGCVAAAITEYYVTHKLNFPPYFTAINPYLSTLDLKDFIVVQDKRTVIQLGNKITALLIKLPLNRKYLNKPIEFILAAHKQGILAKNSLDLMFVNWGTRLGTIFPRPLFEFCTKRYDNTAVVTNVPALKAFTLKGGHRVIQCYATGALLKKSRSCLIICIYDDRVQFTFTVDKNLLLISQHADAICDNIFKYINITYETLLDDSGSN